jgi:hypothetical protein
MPQDNKIITSIIIVVIDDDDDDDNNFDNNNNNSLPSSQAQFVIFIIAISNNDLNSRGPSVRYSEFGWGW